MALGNRVTAGTNCRDCPPVPIDYSLSLANCERHAFAGRKDLAGCPQCFFTFALTTRVNCIIVLVQLLGAIPC